MEDVLDDSEELDYAEPPKEPLFPTHTLPGSPEKKWVMRDRIIAGESVDHPLDRKLHEEEEDWRRRVQNTGLPIAPRRKGVANG